MEQEYHRSNVRRAVDDSTHQYLHHRQDGADAQRPRSQPSNRINNKRKLGQNNDDDADDDRLQTRVIGGSDVQDKWRYLYFAYMWEKEMCGGSLIGPDLVLTAAHVSNSCFEKKET